MLCTEPPIDSGVPHGIDSRHRARRGIQRFLFGSRRHCDGASIQNYDGPMVLAMRGLCAARRESPWIRFPPQFGTLVITPRDEGLQGHEEHIFLDGLPVLSSSTSEISTRASTPREHAQYALRGDRIGEADHPGLVMEALVRAFPVVKDVVLLGDPGCALCR